MSIFSLSESLFLTKKTAWTARTSSKQDESKVLVKMLAGATSYTQFEAAFSISAASEGARSRRRGL